MGQRRDQHLQRAGGIGGQATVRVLDDGDEPRSVGRTLGHDLPELGQMSAQGIDRLRPLPDQKLAHAKHHRRSLRLLALTGTKRIVGRKAASQMASASAASFFWRLTKGFT